MRDTGNGSVVLYNWIDLLGTAHEIIGLCKQLGYICTDHKIYVLLLLL